MSGWVAIPHAALAAAGRDGRLGVLDLYERADRIGYAPMLYTERDLALDWGVDRRAVRRILASLEAAGLIEVERSEPGARKPSRLRVFPGVNQTRNQNWNQNYSASSYTKKNSEPELEPEREPSRAESFAPASDQTRPDQTIVSPPDPPAERGGNTDRRAGEDRRQTPRRADDRAALELVEQVLGQALSADPGLPEPDPPEHATEVELELWRAGQEEEQAARQRARSELLHQAARGDPELAARVLDLRRGELAALGVTRARAVVPLLVTVARARSARGPPE